MPSCRWFAEAAEPSFAPAAGSARLPAIALLPLALIWFGLCNGSLGLGWFIFENRNLLDIPAVFAGLLTVIIIGLFVENLIFRAIERNTVQKWGSQS
ncbi:ABC-type nitrate/sulfonate/bicarbonate transport system permease component [Bradyrhizobium sp. USDA 4486]